MSCFVNGRGEDDKNKTKPISSNATRIQCHDLVKLHEPNANAAVYTNGICLAAFGVTEVQTSTDFEICMFDSEY